MGRPVRSITYDQIGIRRGTRDHAARGGVYAGAVVKDSGAPRGSTRRRGGLKNFTGIDSPNELPEHAEVRIDTTAATPEDAAEWIIAQLRGPGILDQS